MKRHFQCAEQVKSCSNLTKYWACHTKRRSSHMKRHFQCAEQVKSPSNLIKWTPATQNECHQWSASHMKRHFQCTEQVKSPSNLTKYCACHTKSMSSVICVAYETSFPMRGASKVTLQPHQILRLPHKMNVISDLRRIWNVISNARSK